MIIIIKETTFIAAVHNKFGKFEACGESQGGSACKAIEFLCLGGQKCDMLFCTVAEASCGVVICNDGVCTQGVGRGYEVVYTHGVTAGRIHVLHTMIRPGTLARATVVDFANSLDSRIVLRD